MPNLSFKFLTHKEFELLSQAEKVRYVTLAIDALVGWSSGLPGKPFEKPRRRKPNGSP